jgi:hypothetical protein
LSFFKKIIDNPLTLFHLIAIHPDGIDYAIPFIRPFNVLKSRYKFGGSSQKLPPAKSEENYGVEF